MRSTHLIWVACVLLGALTSVACGNDDDGGSPVETAGSSGKSGGAGKGGGSTAGGSNGGGANGGAANGGTGGDAGEAGTGGGVACTDFSGFVHAVIAEDTNGKSAPRAVNGVDFCTTPVAPTAFDDLF